MKTINAEQKLTLQFILGVLVVIAGLVLLFLGFYAVPIGEIGPTVLTAFGEAATFSGALIGVDYKFKYDKYRLDSDYAHRYKELEKKYERANNLIDEEENDAEELDR